MKYILCFNLSILMTFNLFSHTDIEKELLNQLNLYRKKKGLETMSLDSNLSTVALYHANYLAKCKSVGHNTHYDKLPHDEQFDISDHKELDTDVRATLFPDCNMYAEISMQTFSIDTAANIVTLCKSIIDQFASSPKHNEIMMMDSEPNERFKPIVGISVIQVKSNTPGYYCYVVNIDFGVLVN
jgi:hypothetical protein